jgi:hypothetical protein
MELTPYHARYFAHELTKRSSAASVDSLISALADAQVDLNPHQVEAALFAFRSPLSRGAILADEVGLGKTIEAGILLSQRWAERRRRLLVICPANLRKQWAQELADKFFLPSAILETKTFNEEIKRGNLNPFDQQKVVLCSFQFVRTKDAYAPSDSVYWQHGYSTERDFLYATTAQLNHEQLQQLSEEVGRERTLLVLCAAFRGKVDRYPNLTVKKIPKQVLSRCEWGHDDYSLQIENLPKAPPQKGQQSLFDEEEA